MYIIERVEETNLEILVHGTWDEITTTAKLLNASAIRASNGYPLSQADHWHGANSGDAVLIVPETWHDGP